MKYKIRLSYDGFTPEFKELFPECDVEVISDKDKDIDLLIFVGGADVDPKRYNDRNRGYSQINEERDSFEFQLFREFRIGIRTAKKYLGICRGSQFMNVAMGGSLYQDLKHEMGNNHPAIHGFEWKHSVPIFDKITEVNSFHHQGIRYYGENKPGRILAVEPKSRLIEGFVWTDKYLAFQFHPEWIHPQHPTHQIFRKGIYEWLAGNLNIYEGTLKKPKPAGERTVEAKIDDKALFEFKEQNPDWNVEIDGGFARYRVRVDDDGNVLEVE